MKVAISFALAMMLAMVSSASAAELKSGPQVGEEVGAFEVIKAAGNPHDGVKDGEELCYRCKLGSRPVVMIFARQPNEKLAMLVTELDKVVGANAEKKMGSFVNLIGHKQEDAKKAATQLIDKTKAAHVAIVVPTEQNGPKEYKLDPNADVTVLIYKGGKVEANHAISAGALDDKMVKMIIKDTAKILN